MIIPHTTVVFNWRNQKNKSGLYSVHLRITIERESRYYSIETPQKVKEDQWNGKEGAWIKITHPFAFEINQKIIEKKAIVTDLIKRFYNLGKNLDFETIFKHLDKKGDHRSFVDFFDSYNNNPPEKLEINTVKKYRTCLIHLKEFRSKIYFNDIDNLMIRDFYKFLQVKKKLEAASVKKYMDALKKVINQARRESFIDPSQMEFLFDEVKLSGKRSTARVFLEIDEIQAWKKIKFPSDKKFLERDRDMYLFQIYTGYYYKDLVALKKEHLFKDKEFGEFILGERDKNNNPTIIPIYKFPFAKEILKKYQSDTDSTFAFSRQSFIKEPVYNRNLKEIAKLAGINKNISNKVARHTNAQLWVRYGAERTVLSKMLGHQKEETTKNYFSINLPEIVEGTKRADFVSMGI